jgi:hypothetical protein
MGHKRDARDLQVEKHVRNIGAWLFGLVGLLGTACAGLHQQTARLPTTNLARRVALVQIDGLTPDLLQSYLTEPEARKPDRALYSTLGVVDGGSGVLTFASAVAVQKAVSALPADSGYATLTLLTGRAPGTLGGETRPKTLPDVLTQIGVSSASAGARDVGASFEAQGSTSAERIRDLLAWMKSHRASFLSLQFDSLHHALATGGKNEGLKAIADIDHTLFDILHGAGRFANEGTVVVLTSGFGFRERKAKVTTVSAERVQLFIGAQNRRIHAHGGIYRVEDASAAELRLLDNTGYFETLFLLPEPGKPILIYDRDLGGVRPALDAELPDADIVAQLSRAGKPNDAIAVVERRGCSNAEDPRCYDVPANPTTMTSTELFGGPSREELVVPLVFAGSPFRGVDHALRVNASTLDVARTISSLMGVSADEGIAEGNDLSGLMLKAERGEPDEQACRAEPVTSATMQACMRLLAATSDRQVVGDILLRLAAAEATSVQDAQRTIDLAAWMTPEPHWTAGLKRVRALWPKQGVACAENASLLLLLPSSTNSTVAQQIITRSSAEWESTGASLVVAGCPLTLPTGQGLERAHLIAAALARAARAEVVLWSADDARDSYFVTIPTPELTSFAGPSYLGTAVVNAALPSTASLVSAVAPGHQILHQTRNLYHLKRGIETWFSGWSSLAHHYVNNVTDPGDEVAGAWRALLDYWTFSSAAATDSDAGKPSSLDDSKAVLQNAVSSKNDDVRWAAALRGLVDQLLDRAADETAPAPDPQKWSGTRQQFAEAIGLWRRGADNRLSACAQADPVERGKRLERLELTFAPLNPGLAAHLAVRRVQTAPTIEERLKLAQRALDLSLQPQASWTRQSVARSLLWQDYLSTGHKGAKGFDRAAAERLYITNVRQEIENDRYEGFEERNLSRAFEFALVPFSDQAARQRLLASAFGTQRTLKSGLVRAIVLHGSEIFLWLLFRDASTTPKLENLEATLRSVLPKGEPHTLEERLAASVADVVTGLVAAVGAAGGSQASWSEVERAFDKASEDLGLTRDLVEAWDRDNDAKVQHSEALYGTYLKASLAIAGLILDSFQHKAADLRARIPEAIELVAQVVRAQLRHSGEGDAFDAHVTALRDMTRELLEVGANYVENSRLSDNDSARLSKAVGRVRLPLRDGEAATASNWLRAIEVAFKDSAWLANVANRGAHADHDIYRSADRAAWELFRAWKVPRLTFGWFALQGFEALHALAGDARRFTNAKNLTSLILGNNAVKTLAGTIGKAYPEATRLERIRQLGDLRMLLLDIALNLVAPPDHRKLDDSNDWVADAVFARGETLLAQLGPEHAGDVGPAFALGLAMTAARREQEDRARHWAEEASKWSRGTFLEGNDFISNLVETESIVEKDPVGAERAMGNAEDRCPVAGWVFSRTRASLAFARGDRPGAERQLERYLLGARLAGAASLAADLNYYEQDDTTIFTAGMAWPLARGEGAALRLSLGGTTKPKHERTLTLRLSPSGNPTQAATHARLYKAWMALAAGADEEATRALGEVWALGLGLDPALLAGRDLATLPRYTVSGPVFLDAGEAFWVAALAELRGYQALASTIYQLVKPEIPRDSSNDDSGSAYDICTGGDASDAKRDDPPFVTFLRCHIPKLFGRSRGDTELARVVALQARRAFGLDVSEKDWKTALTSASNVAPTILPSWSVALAHSTNDPQELASVTIPEPIRLMRSQDLGQLASASVDQLRTFSCEALTNDRVRPSLQPAVVVALADQCGNSPAAAFGYLDSIRDSATVPQAVLAIKHAILVTSRFRGETADQLWGFIEQMSSAMITDVRRLNPAMVPLMARDLANSAAEAEHPQLAWSLNAQATAIEIVLGQDVGVTPRELIRAALTLPKVPNPELLKAFKKIEFESTGPAHAKQIIETVIKPS